MHLLQNLTYNNISIEFYNVDDETYASATALCQAYGQRVSEWLQLPKTERYIQALGASLEAPLVLTVKKLGEIDGDDELIWIHEALLLNLIRWLDADFGIWCDVQIYTLLQQGRVDATQPQQSYADELRAMARKIDEAEELAAQLRMIDI